MQQRACLCLAWWFLFLGSSWVLAQSSIIQEGIIEPSNPMALLPVDSAAKQKLQAVREYIKVKDWRQSVELLQSLIEAPQDYFLEREQGAGQESSNWTSVRAEARRLLLELPARGRAFYSLKYDRPASELLERAAATGDIGTLVDIVRRYPVTRAGTEALAILGSYHLDRGQVDLAGLWFDLLYSDPLLQKQTNSTLFKALVAFHATGRKERADKVREQVKKASGTEGFRLGSTLMPVEEVNLQAANLARRFHHHDSSYLSWKHPHNPGPLATKLENGLHVPTYQSTRAQRLLEVAMKQAPHERDGYMRMPAASPLFVGDKVVFRSWSGVQQIDARTGRTAWHSPFPLSMEGQLADFNRRYQLERWFNTYRGNAPLNQQGRRSLLYENSVLGSLSSDGRRVYAVEDLALPPHPYQMYMQDNGMKQLFSTLKDAIYYNSLRALDLETGKVLWELGGRFKANPPELAGSYFLGPPLPLSGRLWTIAQHTQELRLLCLDPIEGTILWSQPIGSSHRKMLYAFDHRITAIPLAFADGILVCPTHSGSLVGVDPLTHSLLWAATFPLHHPPEMDSNWAADPNNPPDAPFTPPILEIVDGAVIHSPPNGRSLYCFDLKTGRQLWSRARRPDALFLEPIRKDRFLLVCSTECNLCSVAKVGVLANTFSTGRPVGRGILCGSIYYLPVERGLLALDLEQGDTRLVFPSPSGVTLGNLTFHNGRIWSQGVYSINTILPSQAGK